VRAEGFSSLTARPSSPTGDAGGAHLDRAGDAPGAHAKMARRGPGSLAATLKDGRVIQADSFWSPGPADERTAGVGCATIVQIVNEDLARYRDGT
jgi:hypothetical protein